MSEMNSDKNIVLQLKGISKSFGATRALDDVNIDIYTGEIHSILGQNGAGKSTLVNILDNVWTEFEGEIYFEGKLVPRHQMKDFLKKMLGVVHQEFPLIPFLSIAENIYLADLPKTSFGNIRWKELYDKTRDFLASLKINIPPKTLVKDLTMGERQLISIAHAVSRNPRVLIFDEATSALSQSEVDLIFQLLKDLVDQGVAVIFISHKIEEILSLSQKVTVLRNGHSVITKRTCDTKRQELIQLMAGKEVSQQFPNRMDYTNTYNHEILLEVQNLTGEAFCDCSFTICRGEILGVAGLVGSGRPELIKTLFGAEKGKKSGKIIKHGLELKINSPRDAIRNDIFFVPSDRRKEGVIRNQCITDNTTLAFLKDYSWCGKINKAQETAVTKDYINRLSTKVASEKQLIKELSGGNQQKVIISRWLIGNGEVYLFEEPTRGLDVGVKYDLYEIMNTLKSQGKAIVMISSELPELLAMSDRIIVMHEGRIVANWKNENLDQEEVLSAMMQEGHDRSVK